MLADDRVGSGPVYPVVLQEACRFRRDLQHSSQRHDRYVPALAHKIGFAKRYRVRFFGYNPFYRVEQFVLEEDYRIIVPDRLYQQPLASYGVEGITHLSRGIWVNIG